MGVQLGQSDSAGTDLLALAVHPDTKIGACTDGLAAMLGSQEPQMETLKSAMELMLERFPGDTHLPVRLAELIYKQEEQVCHRPNSM